MQIGLSNGDDVTFYYIANDNPTDDKDEDDDESPSQRIDMADDNDDEANDQELGSVNNTTMTIENLKMKETGIQLLKLMWGECVEA